MRHKLFYRAAMVSFGAHVILAALLILSQGPFGISAREGNVVCFEITLADSPRAKADSSVSQQEPAKTHEKNVLKKREPARPAGMSRESTTDPRPVVLASLGTLSDATSPAKPAGSGETASSTQRSGKVQGAEAPSLLVLPRYRETVRPEYPWIARVRGYEGTVLLSAEILGNGAVGNLAVKKTSGFALLDQSALNTVRNWKFEPGRESGGPAPMWVDVPVRFTLKD